MRRKILLLSLLLLIASYFTINTYGFSTGVELKLDKNEYVGLGDRINITIIAPGLNAAKNSAEHLELQIYTSEDSKGFITYIQETEANSGIFKGQLLLSNDKSNAKLRTIKVSSGITIYIMYKELIGEAVWQPDDGTVKLDKKAYGGYGVRPVVMLTDNDLNIDPFKKEEIDVIAYSTTDSKGIQIKLAEKKQDSGVFTGDFGLDEAVSDNNSKKLKVSYNDTITIEYNDKLTVSGVSEKKISSAVWKPGTGTIKLNRSDYTGLYTIASVSVADQDLNLRHDYKDIARIRITSKADPQGFVILANETGANTGVFSGSFKFGVNSTDSDKSIIKVSPTDTIIAAYIDERNSDNIANTAITATASFQFSEAKIQTSAANDEGIGNMLDITISDPDANNPNIKDSIVTKVGSGDSTYDMTLYLEETGSNTGNFKGKLYLTGDEPDGGSLQVAGRDKINIKYIDKTTPEGTIKEIIKTVSWSYQSSLLKLDKEAYSGYNSSAKITLTNMDLNKDKNKIELVEVKVSTTSGSIGLKLTETSADAGEFSGTLYFGRSSSRSDGIIRVANKDTILISYTNKKDKDDRVEYSAAWSPQDGQITLDRQEYKGDSTPVRITVKDWDLADDKSVKDEVKVIARIQGSAKYVSVTLTETNKNSGIFSGILYINGSSGKRPSITLKPVDKLEVVYTDKDTTSGSEEARTAYASWGGISEAKLTLDKEAYRGYDTYMTINLNDPDQNKSTTARDKVDVSVKTKSGKTNMEYTLTETGNNTGIFSVKLKFTEEAPASGRVRVMASDEVTVSFKEKGVQSIAEFER